MCLITALQYLLDIGYLSQAEYVWFGKYGSWSSVKLQMRDPSIPYTFCNVSYTTWEVEPLKQGG